MDFSTLKQLAEVYPMLIKPFKDLSDPSDSDITLKINTIVQYLNQIGQVSNDTVNSWNKVMVWTMDEGLTDSVNAKIDDMVAKGTFNDLLTSLTNTLLGSEVLGTVSQDVKGAINEVLGIANANTLALGSEVLVTTNKDVKGAINEVKGIADSNTSALADMAMIVHSNGIDDTQAIQNAINNINTNGGGTLLLPDSLYIIKDTTSEKGVKPCSNLKVIGGQNTTLKLGASVCNIFSNYVEDFSISGYGSLNNVTFENLIFDGDYHNMADPGNDNYGYGIYIVRAKNITVKNCKFYRNWYSGMVLWGTDTQLIQDCYFEDIGNQTTVVAGSKGSASICSDGTPNAPSRNVTIERNVFKNCYYVFHASGGANNGAVLESDSWFIRENKIYGATVGVQFYNGWYTHVNICDNIFDDIQWKAISITGNGNDQTTPVSTPLGRIRVERNQFTIKTAPTVTNTGLIYAYSADLISVSGNEILSSVDLPTDFSLIVVHAEWNGTAYVPWIGKIVDNNIKVGRLKYVFNLDNGFVRLERNIVNAGAVNNVITTSSTVDVRMYNNELNRASGTAWNRSYKTRIVKENMGLKTEANGSTSVVGASATVPHGITAGAPAIIVGSLKDSTYPNYTVGFQSDATNITIKVFDGAGNASTQTVTVGWVAKHADSYSDAV